MPTEVDSWSIPMDPDQVVTVTFTERQLAIIEDAMRHGAGRHWDRGRITEADEVNEVIDILTSQVADYYWARMVKS